MAVTARVFSNPDGSIRVMKASEKARRRNESDAVFYKRIFDQDMAKDPTLAGLPFVDLTADKLEPLNKGNRHQWRLRNGRLVEDAAVSKPLPPRVEALLADIDNAKDTDEMKAILRRIVTGQ